MFRYRVKALVFFRKFRKLINNPGIFLRDMLINKYPYLNTELIINEQDELPVIEQGIALENKIGIANFPVDVVFTWVDNSDVNWQKKYTQAKESTGGNFSFFATDDARFANHDELYYSVAAVKRHLPWVRKIFILTDQQIPAWYKADEQIEIVFHHDVIEPQYLPTFNSHVIEAHLHLIPGLSEHFIYFNDDVFVARWLPKGHFFGSNGLAALFVSDKLIATKDTKLKKFQSPTRDASLNSQSLLYQKYEVKIHNKLVHTYQPLKKSMYRRAWSYYTEEIRAFLANKFRGDNDVNMATYLVPWLTYIEGGATERLDVCYYFNIRSPHAPMQYRKLLEKQQQGRQPHSFCANDFTVKIEANKDYHKQFKNMLAQYYSD